MGFSLDEFQAEIDAELICCKCFHLKYDLNSSHQTNQVNIFIKKLIRIASIKNVLLDNPRLLK